VDYQQILKLLALLNGKAGGQITGADLSRLDNPILGVLLGTYKEQQDTGPNLAELSYQHRPTWESLQNDEYYDEDSIEMRIASSLANGMPLMEIKKTLPQRLQEAGLPYGPNDTTYQDLINFATKLDSENHSYNVAVTKANADRRNNSWWAQMGISDPNLKADPNAILSPQLEQLVKMYKPMTDPNKTGGYMGSGGNYVPGTRLPNVTTNKINRIAADADARNAAEVWLRNRPFWQQNANERAKEAEQRYVEKQVAKTAIDPNTKTPYAGDISRERTQMLVRREAMGGKSPTSTVPIYAAKLNREAEDEMLRVAAVLRERAEKKAAAMPTPAQTDIMNLILTLAMAERLKK